MLGNEFNVSLCKRNAPPGGGSTAKRDKPVFWLVKERSLLNSSLYPGMELCVSGMKKRTERAVLEDI